MLERNIPYRERFKLCVARLDTALVFVIELRKAGCHFSAAGTGGSYNNKLSARLYVIIFTVAAVAHNFCDIRRIAVNLIVMIYGISHRAETLLKLSRFRRRAELREHNAANHKTYTRKLADKTNNVIVIGYAEVAPAL